MQWIQTNSDQTWCIIMSPQLRGVGTYCFWCGSRWHPCSFLSALYLLNQWMDFDQTGKNTLLGRGKEVIRFWWPYFQWSHQHFECQILTKNSLSASYFLNQMMDSGQDLIWFWWPWPNFQVHHTIKTVKKKGLSALSPEPIGGFWPNLHICTIWTWERSD